MCRLVSGNRWHNFSFGVRPRFGPHHVEALLSATDRLDEAGCQIVRASGGQGSRTEQSTRTTYATELQQRRQRLHPNEAARARVDGDLTARYVDGAGTENRAAAARNPLYGLIEQRPTNIAAAPCKRSSTTSPSKRR